MDDNKGLLTVTIIVVVVTIVALFGLLFIFAPKPISEDVLTEKLYREDTYIAGTEGAPVQIVAFEDFECPACQQAELVFSQILAEYGDVVEFRFRHFPLTNIHPNAIPASLAAEAAGAQGLFYEYEELLYERQTEWSNLSGDELRAQFIEYAEQVGVEDISQFTLDYDDQTYLDKINRDQEDGLELGVQGTPTVYLNGEVINASYPIISNRIEEIVGERDTGSRDETSQDESGEESGDNSESSETQDQGSQE